MRKLLLLLFLCMPILGFSQIHDMKIIKSTLYPNSKCFDVQLIVFGDYNCSAYVNNGYESSQQNVNYYVVFRNVCFPRQNYSYNDRIDCGLICPSNQYAPEGCVVTIEGKID